MGFEQLPQDANSPLCCYTFPLSFQLTISVGDLKNLTLNHNLNLNLGHL